MEYTAGFNCVGQNNTENSDPALTYTIGQKRHRFCLNTVSLSPFSTFLAIPCVSPGGNSPAPSK
jgi:hypothetical protein